MGKTVGELLDTMTMAEYHCWIEFYREEAQASERARRSPGEIRTDDPDAAKRLVAAATGKGAGAKSMKGPAHRG